MHIVVLIKQVPESEDLRYNPFTRTLVREGVETVINPFDKRALTEATRLRDLYGGTITAVTMGPPEARDALVECLGRGVDRAFHLNDTALAGSDTLATARALSAALRRISFDLLLGGKWSTDAETGQVCPEVAEMLGLPQVTGAISIALEDEAHLRVVRETDTGTQTLLCPLPAVVTAAEQLIKPVKTKPDLLEKGQKRITEDPSLITTLRLEDLGLAPEDVGLQGSATWVADLRSVQVERAGEILVGDPDTVAENLLLALDRQGLRRARRPQIAEPDEPSGLQTLPTAAPDPHPAKAVWAVAEWIEIGNAEGLPKTLRPVSYELMGGAALLASQVGGAAVGVLLGTGIRSLADGLVEHGAQTVLLADSPHLPEGAVENYASVLAGAIERYKPWAVLLPATDFGRDLAPRVAARLGLGLTADCLGLEVAEDGALVQFKPAFGGQVVAPILSKTLPAMSTIRPGMLPRYAPDPSRVTSSHVVNLDTSRLRQPEVRLEAATYEGAAGLALDSARLVICVGTGIGGPEALGDVEQLAAALGSWMGLSEVEVAIGGTRKVTDAGWLPRQQQIGITGRAVSPDLYLTLGVQGKFNHMVGVLGSRTIVSVNTDPEAQVFQMSDFGVVSDWRAFTAALLKRLA